ncbi:TonB-dependent receptor domain-containing protein [Flavobacterium sp.]|uniref:TonB-dependent receptor domain-containing protein n=1 Tax=Flavobacterium sp. TaxID=239 RepID=UPI002B4B586F|nr:TonB-dependent receptor [Flavobacterium sp.]HLP63258.1 TonB-dependent receptor [Flavobacterium sp.]
MTRLILWLTLLLVTACQTQSFGQNSSDKVTFSGKLISENNDKITFSEVFLYQNETTILIKTELTNENGEFVFTGVPKGNYIVKTNWKDEIVTVTSITLQSETNLGTLTVKTQSQQLQEVVVERKKSFIERSEGKMILNLDSNIGSAGSSAFEVLEKAPSVNIDDNDNISLRGKNNVLVQIDGKLTPMTGTNLGNYLRGIPSNAVEKIEFITNPSSKYDASGTAIINIKMKKDKRKGTNGSVSVAYGQGVYPKSNNGLTLNHRNKKVALFGNYSFAYREGFNKLLLVRQFYENNNFIGAYDQDNFLKMDFRNHIGRIGMDYFANDKHTFGISVNKVSNRFNPNGENATDVYDENNVLSSRFRTSNRSKDHWQNHSVNLNHKVVLDTLGTEIVTDFDYANYGNITKQNFTTRYLDLNNNEFQNPYLLYGDVKGDLDIFSLKSDFVTTFKNKLKLESGYKTSYVKADNNLAFFDRSSGIDVFDPTKSNHFIYKENINALYVNSSKTFGKWSAQLGLRIENTNITGEQLVDNTSFKNSYTQLFPSLFVSYNLNDKNSLEFNYSRRIARPSYDQLNPFKFYLDPTTYKEGNPFLNPETTHSLEITHVLNQKIYTTLNFSRTNNNIAEVIAPSDTDAQVTIQTNKNLDTFDLYGLFVVMPLEFTQWWSSTNSINCYYGAYSGTIANTTIKNQGNFNYNMNSVNNFKITKSFTSELTANYRAREIYAFMDVNPIWFINVGFQKKFKNNSSLKLVVNDVFYTNRTTADTEFTNYKEGFKVSRDTRVAILSYTYNFGTSNNQARRRTGGADDLKQRANSSNG